MIGILWQVTINKIDYARNPIFFLDYYPLDYDRSCYEDYDRSCYEDYDRSCYEDYDRSCYEDYDRSCYEDYDRSCKKFNHEEIYKTSDQNSLL